jgi:hypothetical protein
MGNAYRIKSPHAVRYITSTTACPRVIVKFLLLLVLIEGCTSNHSNKKADLATTQDSIPKTILPPEQKRDSIKIENFHAFYDHFMADSIFQIQRIQFPLPTLNTDSFTVHDGNIVYKEYATDSHDWILLRALELNKYKHQYPTFSDSVVVEEIIFVENSGFKDVFTYKSIDQKWFLVKYGMYNL